LENNQTTSLSNEFPWLMFKLQENIFAINSKSIASIVHIDEKIKIKPSSDKFIRGTFKYLSKEIQLVDMRSLLSIDPIGVDYEKFCKMLDMRKNDHVTWVEELERCANNNLPFKLATDPHECAFGKWYDAFETDSNAVNFHMRMIEDPHKDLHKTAIEVLSCSKECDKCEREECLKTSLSKAKNKYMPMVVDLLEEAKHIFIDEFKEMIIVIACGNKGFGIIVDEVSSVEKLDFLNKKSHEGITYETQIVQGVGKTRKSEKLVLLVDTEKIAQVVK